MKRRKALSVMLVVALMASAAGCGGGEGGDASGATAVEMRVQRRVGTVSLSNDKGESVTLMEKMRLNAGHNLDTAKESFVMVSFDETKVMTLEENASASVVQKGSALQFDVKKGRALVNLTEPLKDGQSAEVRSGNMVCGMTGTAVEGENKDGKTTVKVLESDAKKVTITVLDGQGNPTSQTEAKPGEMAVLQGDGATVDISNCNLEDYSAASLYAIGQNPDLVKKAAETYGVPEDHVNILAKLVSTEGANAGPLNGAAAEVMEKALKDTKGVTGDALNVEQSILTNTRQLLDKVMAGQMTDEEKKSLLNTANEQMNTVVKAALDAGVQGEDLNNIAKDVAEHIANVASTAIDEGKSVEEINDQTKASGSNLGEAVTQNRTNETAMVQAIDRIIHPQVPQQATNPVPLQPQTPQAGNQNQPQQDTPAISDDSGDDDSGSSGSGSGGNGSGGSGSGSGGSGGDRPQPTSEAQQPSSSAEQGESEGQGGSGDSGGQQSTPTQTTGVVTTDGSTATLSDGTVVGFIEPANTSGGEGGVSILNSNTHLNLPLILTMADGNTVKIEHISQIDMSTMDADGCVITGVADSGTAILRTVNTDASHYTISNSMTTISKANGSTTAAISKGDSRNINELFNILEYYMYSLDTITYENLSMTYDNDKNSLSINGTLSVTNPRFSAPNNGEYLLIEPGEGTGGKYRINQNGAFEGA